MVDWPTSTKTQQAEWIGRSEGAEIDFPIVGPGGEVGGLTGGEALRVFTTRPDTIFGATYMVVAPEHPLVEYALEGEFPETNEDALRAYVDRARNLSDLERQESKEKTGVFTGICAMNPATHEQIPIWTADYVLMGYGTGAIMAVPAQDERDWDFAKAFDLPIVRTVQPPEGWDEDKVYTGDGPAINSQFLDGLPVAEAKSEMIRHLENAHRGQRKINYKLRDWLFSRQRYWGEPFPIVYDERGNHHPVGEHTLPVPLPEMADYKPVESDEPQPLLGKATEWLKTTAAEAGVDSLPPDTPLTRETNTMPGWAGSCWYHLRYCDPTNNQRLAGREAESYWMTGSVNSAANDDTETGGIDLYIGGAEHAVLHLLYSRFWHKVLFDLGHISTPEPFKKLFHQGLILSSAYQRPDKSLVALDEVENRGTDESPEYFETATGEAVTQITAKMSKSLKNVVNPDDVIAEYGADTFRIYEMYMGPLDASKPWNTRDMGGMFRFLARAWRLCIDEQSGEPRLATEMDAGIEKLLHRTIHKVGGDIERLAFNTAIASMIELVNAATKLAEQQGAVLTAGQMDRLARVLAPFVPHMADEIWHRLGRERSSEHGSVADAAWPEVDESMLVDDAVEVPVQILGKVRSRVTVPADADEKALEGAALADPKIQSLIEGKTVRKVIVVKGRLVNIVAN